MGWRLKVERVLSSKLLSRARAAENVASAGLKSPYYDPLIKHNKRLYSELIRKLHSAGVVEFRRSCREHVGIFTVWKKSGKQRLVVDARLTNCWFDAPEGVQLATGSSFSAIEVDGGPPIALGGVDIADAFYQIELPSSLRDLFGLLPLRAGLLGISDTVEGPVGIDDKVFPVFKAIPMGWTQALWVCQHCHEAVVNGLEGLDEHNRLKDNKIPPAMRPFIHTEYVDNFLCLSQDGSLAREMAERVDSALQERGLPTHEVETSIGGCALGWEFSDSQPRVHLSRARLWKYRLALQELLKSGRCSSRTLEKVVGHLTFAGLVRREFLSVFQASYVYMRKGYGERAVIWDSVRRELRWACALLPLLQKDLGMEWSEEVHATDASFWGRGITVTRREQHDVRALGQFNERWRFKATEECEVVQGKHIHADLLPFDVPVGFIGSQWRQVDGAKWEREESIPVLEGRALVWLGQHLARSRRQHGKKHLVLTDSMSAILALSKGRSSAGVMNRVCRQHAALMFATGMYFGLRWVPSELNPADRPSRGKALGDFDAVTAAREWAEQHADKDLKGCTQSWRERAFDALESLILDSDAEHAVRKHSHPQQATSGASQSQEQSAPHPQAKGCSEHSSTVHDLPGAAERFAGQGAKLSQRPAQVGELAGNELGSPGLADGPRALAGVRGRLHGGAVLGRGRPVGDCHVPRGLEILQPRASSSKVLVESEPSHARIQKAGPHYRARRHTVANVVRRPKLAGPAQEVGGSVVGSCHLGLDVPPRGVTPAQMGPCGEALQNEQVLCFHPQRKPGSRRVPQTVQSGRVRRGPGGGPALPPVVGESASSASGKVGRGCSGVRLRHRGGLKDVQRSVRRAGLCPARGGECISDAPRVCLDRCPGESQDPQRDHEARPLAIGQLCSQIRERRKVARDLRQAQPSATRAHPSSREPDWRDITGLKASREGPPVILEIFAGSGRMSAAFRREFGMLAEVYEVVIQHGPQFDLTHKRFQRFVRSLLLSGKVVAVWIGTPCFSWSRLRQDDGKGPLPVRNDSESQLYGLPGLSSADQARVRAGNTLMRFSASIAEICLSLRIPFCIENPWTSRIWLTRQFRSLLKSSHVHFSYTDFCGDLQAWRKRTGLLFGFVDLYPCLKQCSTRQGLCSFSNCKHLQLIGQRQGEFLTKLAEPYPRPLCKRIAKAFYGALVSRWCSNVWNRIS